MIATNLTTDININRASLAQLSVTAAELWDSIENCPEGVKLADTYAQLLDIQNATEAKVDAIAYVADQLKLDLEMWSDRLSKITALYQDIIQRRRNQLDSFKSYLLRLYKLGLIPEQVVGTERRIDFQNNPPSVVLLVEAEQLPSQFQSVKVSSANKEILAAHKAGEDVSSFAEILTEKHVRFKHITRKKR
ncbi:siphovirus Gp157 family protein [Argonema antarcticum]|uniref:siphovirus Gp157 family protein n=1 Tax=Argonema antarcticum TaxID=2942763 RepID=UPI002011E64D|nr:siphovirus Gp157 family protein [Argonema antarcticum]MCL1474681.1 siphovirus Gp157 family protein [Argonema antarcticum A004/B2]